MWDLMWALKKSFKVSVSTMYFSLDKRKTRLESVLHSVSVCVSHRSLLSIIIPKLGVLPLVQLSLHVVTDQTIKVTADASAL